MARVLRAELQLATRVAGVKKSAACFVFGDTSPNLGGSMARSLAALPLSLALVVVGAAPASALDCGHRLVTTGDSEGYVRSICGEPESVMTRTESRTQFVTSPYGDQGALVGSATTVTIQIDVWTYDFGSTRFREELTFADGILRSSRPLGYGTARGDRRRRDSLREGALDRDRIRLHDVAIADRRRIHV
jgi:hypothetical protein